MNVAEKTICCQANEIQNSVIIKCLVLEYNAPFVPEIFVLLAHQHNSKT